MLTRGVLRSSIPPTEQTPIVLRVSGGTSVLFDDLSDEELVALIADPPDTAHATGTATTADAAADGERGLIATDLLPFIRRRVNPA